jgi:uncharacterized protein involved in exopolysaccharide biosynthesis
MVEICMGEMKRPEGANGGRRDDIDLLEMASTLWRGRWLIVSGFLLAALVSVFISLRMPNIYRSEALLAPAPKSQDAVSNVVGKYGGLASLAGIDLGGFGKAAVDQTTITLEMLKSRAFIIKFVREHNLVVPLIAAKGWDQERESWIIDTALYDEKAQVWVRAVSPPYQSEPSDLEIYEAFVENVLTVSQDNSTLLVSLAVESMSPIAARDWASWLVQDVNSVMRERDISQASKSIDYLERQLEETVVAEMRQIFYQLIEQETKKKMLAKVQAEYVLEVIDPPVIPDRKVSPKRAIIVLVCCFFSVLLVAAFLLLKESLLSDGSERRIR